MPFVAVNLATGETIASYPETLADEVGRIVERAHEAHVGWRDQPVAARAARLTALGSVLRERAEDFARLMTAEMGKPLNQAIGEALRIVLGIMPWNFPFWQVVRFAAPRRSRHCSLTQDIA